MDLRTLQKETHAIAKDHGWWDEPRTFGDLIALVHSELSEALEAYRGKYIWRDWRQLQTYPNGRPRGVASELADVVIRVADMAEHYGVDLTNLAPVSRSLWDNRSPVSLKDDASFGDWLRIVHKVVSNTSSPRVLLGSHSLARVIRVVQQMAAHYGIDLDAAIEAKMEYNRTRPYRHGGKAL